jgi:hypothetical protein
MNNVPKINRIELIVSPTEKTLSYLTGLKLKALMVNMNVNYNLQHNGMNQQFEFTHGVDVSQDGLREAKERQSQVDKTVLEPLELLVSLDQLAQLKAHEAHDHGGSSGNGGQNLASNTLTLQRKGKFEFEFM